MLVITQRAELPGHAYCDKIGDAGIDSRSSDPSNYEISRSTFSQVPLTL